MVGALATGSVVAQGRGTVENLGDPGAKLRLDIGQLHREIPGLRRGVPELAGPDRRRGDGRGEADRATPIQVQVVFPRVSDRPEHGQRVQREVGQRGHRDQRRPGGGGLALRTRLTLGAHGVPGCRRGQFAVQVQRRRLVLQGLKRPDWLPELLSDLQVGDGVLGTPPGDARGLGGHQRGGGAAHRRRVEALDDRGTAGRVVSGMQRADVPGQIRRRLDADVQARGAGVEHEPHLGAAGGTRRHQYPLGRAHPDPGSDRPGQRPASVHGAGRQLARTRGEDRRGATRRDIGQQRRGGRSVSATGRHGARDHSGQQGAGQQAVTGRLDHAGHVR